MILVLTNADTEILALRVVVEGLPDGFPAVRAANPDRLGDGEAAFDALPAFDEIDLVLVRLLGGRGSWPDAFDELQRRCRAARIPLIAVGGEATADPDLMAASTVPSATVAQAFAYWVAGGPSNLEQLLRFAADSVLMEGFGFEPPVELPLTARWGDWPRTPGRPRIGVVFYRAHVLSGNTGFVDDLCTAIDAAGADPVPVSTYSLRPDADGQVPAVDLLAAENVDVVVTTVLAMGHGDADGDGWIVPRLPELDVPVVQALCATRGRDEWESGGRGLTPMDAAMQVAIPEFDGRIITVPISFKEVVDDGDVLGADVTAYRAVPDRVARVAGIAVRLARLRHLDPADTKVAVVLSAYPTKRARLGNAVGLDTPASVLDLLDAMRRAGYRVDRIPASGDDLMAELADRLTYDRDTLTPQQAERAVGAMEPDVYRRWFAALPKDRRDEMVEHHGEAPGSAYLDGNDRQLFTGIDLGGVLVCIQPPRGFGEDPIAIYHDPDLPPTHHYLGFYRWLDEVWGADAVVHVGKHGTLEWLPGKGSGMSAGCYPDAALGDLPFFYPFIVNDPGEGTQAKRRAHAVVIDHLLPPMTRAETYDELARLEDLLDAHAHLDALDPSKLPAIRRQVWDLLVEAELHRDLGLDGRAAPDGDAFNDLILDVDGYLCELKDARIRGGLHTLGVAPVGEALVDLVLALTRLPQGDVPALTTTVEDRLFGLDSGNIRPKSARAVADAVEAECRHLIEEAHDAGWSTGGDDPTIGWVCSTLVPALTRTTDEIGHLLHGLAGGHVPSGPSGAPTRGMAHVLPTGRNFYSVDPKSVPSPLAWEVGMKLADALVARHVTEEGRAPTTVGLVLWGTAAMRTSGDDAAQALALLGVRPRWDDISGRVIGLEAIDPEELGRPRVDVTLRISGFFRDAFPNLITLLDDAVRLVAELDEPPEHNPIRAHGSDDPRVFGPRPGGYGSGILSLLESGSWRDDDDLAAVYQTWGGFAYGRDRFGEPAPDAMRRRFAAIQVAVKNQDNREHDIFDSDDYLQEHGGMVATVRALTGAQPKAWFGDTSDPNRPRVRSLAEEAARVVRTRVINPKWIDAMKRHGYKGAFELAATVDYLFGYDATAHVVEDWMYERVTQAYVADADVRAFFERSNPWALRSIAERLLEARDRRLWDASDEAVATLRSALLEAEGWEEDR